MKRLIRLMAVTVATAFVAEGVVFAQMQFYNPSIYSRTRQQTTNSAITKRLGRKKVSKSRSTKRHLSANTGPKRKGTRHRQAASR